MNLFKEYALDKTTAQTVNGGRRRYGHRSSARLERIEQRRELRDEFIIPVVELLKPLVEETAYIPTITELNIDFDDNTEKVYNRLVRRLERHLASL